MKKASELFGGLFDAKTGAPVIEPEYVGTC